MVRSEAKELGVLGIVKEALRVPVRNSTLTAAVLLVLLPCNLLITVPKLSLRVSVNVTPLGNRLPLRRQLPADGEPPTAAEPGEEPPPAAAAAAKVPRFKEVVFTVRPLNFAIAQLTTVALVYLSAVACKDRHATAGALVSKVRRSWKKVAVSLLYYRLFYVTYSIFFLMLGTVTTMFQASTLVLLLVMLSLFSTFCFAALVFLYLNIACQLSLVISAVEEDKSGVEALAKAVSLTRGRRLRCLLLMALVIAMQKALVAANPKRAAGEKPAQIVSPAVVVMVERVLAVLINLGFMLFFWLMWTVHYHECKTRHGSMGKEGRVDEAQSLTTMSNSVHGDLT